MTSSPATQPSSAAKTGSSRRISAARDGDTIRWAHTIPQNATAVANTPVKAAAAHADAGMASPPVTALPARQATPTVVTCTQVRRMASWCSAVSPRITMWAANATAHPRVSTSPRPKDVSGPPVSSTRPATARTRLTSVSGWGRRRRATNVMIGTNTTSR